VFTIIKHIVLPILLIALLPLILKLLIKLRCGIAIGYIVLANTVLRDWANNNTQISDGILFAMVAVTTLSWGVTIYKKVAEHYGFSRTVRKKDKLLATRIKAAVSAGVPLNEVAVKSANGLPIVRC
jgi:hypothetical protein